MSAVGIGGREVPCIEVGAGRYGAIMAAVAGRAFAVDAGLDILQDGLGHVFVEVALDFSPGGITERFLINAATNIAFFEGLAETSVLALAGPGREDVLAVQLPRPGRAREALGMIRAGLARGGGGAVTGI